MQLYAVNFISLLSSLYMFRETSSRDNLRQPMIVPVPVDAVELCTPDDGRVCRSKHVE